MVPADLAVVKVRKSTVNSFTKTTKTGVYWQTWLAGFPANEQFFITKETVWVCFDLKNAFLGFVLLERGAGPNRLQMRSLSANPDLYPFEPANSRVLGTKLGECTLKENVIRCISFDSSLDSVRSLKNHH